MSVSSLNTKIKSLLEATFMHTLVEGEVASVTYHTSGHLYFSIKDDKSAIKCVMWRSSVARMKFRIEKGMKIVVEGSVSVYTPRGEYQFQTVRIEPSGQGALALAYEQLKQRLKAKGYFAQEHKKVLPKIPKRIALVTAKESAALHDMLKIIQKRWALVEVSIVDTLVQGEMAAPQIAKALAYADGVDVVVVGRGGGSTEDLWAFNEEVVADALFAMQTPVVSAVGHEVDTLMSDYVADLRAPTPSAAMEMILPDCNEVLYILGEYQSKLQERVLSIVEQKSKSLLAVESHLNILSPSRQLDEMYKESALLLKMLKDEMRRHRQRATLLCQPLFEAYQRAMAQVLKQKSYAVVKLEEEILRYNPQKESFKGWVQLSQKGRRVSLDDIEVEDTFTIEDSKQKIEAICLSYEKYK